MTSYPCTLYWYGRAKAERNLPVLRPSNAKTKFVEKFWLPELTPKNRGGGMEFNFMTEFQGRAHYRGPGCDPGADPGVLNLNDLRVGKAIIGRDRGARS